MGFFNYSKHILGKKLLFYIILISSTITFIFTVISFVIDYRNETEQMNKVFSFIERTNLPSISKAVYMLVNTQIMSQGEGIFKHPDIIKVEIFDEDGEHLFHKEKSSDNLQAKDESSYIFIVEWLPINGFLEEKEFSLTHEDEADTIGKLNVVLSKDNMYKRLIEKLIVFFVTQFIKTMIVSFAILTLFYFLVTQHLAKMSDFLTEKKKQIKTNEPGLLTLNRKPPKKEDELEILKLAVNEMYSKSWQTRKAILENINQGIITVDNLLEIGPDFSPHTIEILAVDALGGKNLKTILENSNLDESKIEQIRSTIETSVGEPLFAFSLNQHHLPNRIEYRKKGEEKPVTLEVFWDTILDVDGNISQILVSIKDITYLEEMESELKKKSLEANIIREILNSGRNNFHKLTSDKERYFSDIQSGLKNLDKSEVMIALHTFKGNAFTLGYNELGNIIHICEDFFKKNKLSSRSSIHHEKINKLKELVQSYDRLANTLFSNSNNENESFVKISQSAIVEKYPADFKKHFFPVEKMIDFYTKSHLNANSLFTPINKYLPEMAKKLNKLPPKIHVKGGMVFLKEETFNFLSEIFNHLVRNSLDHGIEPPEIRIANGKTKEGNIKVNFNFDMKELNIVYSDDGTGININKIRKKINDHDSGDEFIAQQIFNQELSTASKVTEISGRGIGMHAVEKMLKKKNGSISLRLTDSGSSGFRPFLFTITIPFNSVSHVNMDTRLQIS